MSSILKKFSFVDLSSKKNESNDSPKPIRSNSLRSQFTRSLDSITSTLRQSFGRTKSKHSNSSNSSLDGVTLQHKSSGKKEKLMGGRAFMSRLNFGPKIPSTGLSR